MADPAPLALHETTTEVARWQQAVSSSFVPLTVHTPARTAFNARLDGRVSDGVLFSTVRATRHAVERTPQHIEESPGDYVKLTLQLAGTGKLVQDDRTATLNPGDIALYDTSRPYTLEFESDLAAVVVMFPHRMIDADPETLRELTAICIRGENGFARAVSHFLAGLASALPTLDGSTGLRITHNTMDLIATMVSSELRGGSSGEPASRLLFRIDTYINGNLHEPELGPEMIAAANYISTRHLHTLFQRRGTTVSQWVRERRLEHVRRDLIDPRRGSEGIAAIAASWGFVDASHFSKAFRAYVGAAPSSYRASANLPGLTEP